jgi:phage terminase small subunit
MKRKPPTVEITRAAPTVDELDGLRTDRQILFVIEYCKDFNATQAAIRAGYAERSAAEIGYELLRKPQIQDAVNRRLAQIAAAAEVDSALVISELYHLAMADPRELMRVETDCCRHCYGISYKYQYTPAEYERALTDALSVGKSAPELLGGIGYDPRRPPMESCPECFGRGLERVTVTPSRKLSKAAAKLLASMKQAKDGSIELKTRDQDAALIALGRVVGAFKDRQELTGANGGPLALTAVPLNTLTNDQLKEILRRNGHPVLELTEGATNDHER